MQRFLKYLNLAFSGLQGKYTSSHISRQKWSILPRWRTTVLTIVSDVNISIHSVTRVTFLWKSCKNIHFDVFRAKIIIFMFFRAKMIIRILSVQKYISLHHCLFRLSNSKVPNIAFVLGFHHVHERRCFILI